MPSTDGTAATSHAKISTHILDTVTGDPARDVYVRLERRDSDGWKLIAEGRTDDDGRLRHRVPLHDWQAGGYRLVFYVEPYLGGEAFFPVALPHGALGGDDLVAALGQLDDHLAAVGLRAAAGDHAV